MNKDHTSNDDSDSHFDNGDADAIHEVQKEVHTRRYIQH